MGKKKKKISEADTYTQRPYLEVGTKRLVQVVSLCPRQPQTSQTQEMSTVGQLGPDST